MIHLNIENLMKGLKMGMIKFIDRFSRVIAFDSDSLCGYRIENEINNITLVKLYINGDELRCRFETSSDDLRWLVSVLKLFNVSPETIGPIESPAHIKWERELLEGN